MTPIKEIVPGFDIHNIIYAKNQSEYLQLPAYKEDDGTVTTRWKLTFKERFRVLFKGSLYLTILTFNKPLQPVRLDSKCPLSCPFGE